MHWYLLGALGPGRDTDALFASLALPQVLLAIIASSFMNVIVPLLSGESDTDFRRNAWTFATVTFAAFCALGVVLALLADFWVPVIAPGLPPQTRELAVHLSRIQLIGMVCTAMAGILAAVHRVRRNFYWVESVPVIATVVGAVMLVTLLPRYGIYAAAWAWVARIGVNAVLLVTGLGRFAGLTEDRAILARAWGRIRPLVIGTAYFRTEPLFDRALVSLAPAGDLSLYYLCQQVCFAAVLLAHNALIAPLAPTLAMQVKAGDWAHFSEARRRSARTVLLLAVAGYAGLVVTAFGVAHAGVLAEPAATTASRVSWLLVGLGGAFIAGPLFESVRSAFYATGNTATPVRLEAVVFTCGLIVKAAGFMAFGVLGLAGAASLQVVLGVYTLRRTLASVETASARQVREVVR